MIVTLSLVRSPTARRVGTQVVAHRSWTTRTGSPVPRSACERFEPDAWKQARPVLRGRDGGNTVLLPGGAAAAIGVFPGTIYQWLRRGRLTGHQLAKGLPWQIPLTEAQITELKAYVQRVRRLKKEAS